ncbi:SDR family NAD(P)-dependent oxidoreductase [Nocardia beijingensis]|uniref:SDR family NAD(P)-dependent oxidoreductase n=1 Tax=Nocardia beijingensis TaxID=95162 RepID=UPI00332813F0
MNEIAPISLDLSDKVVLVTGAARGQGAEHARRLSALGARLVLGDLDRAEVGGVAAGLPGALAVELDVRRADAWRTVAGGVHRPRGFSGRGTGWGLLSGHQASRCD